jgi:hypothetical protein
MRKRARGVGAGRQFDTAANFTHQFFLPFGGTFDYVNTKLSITG